MRPNRLRRVLGLTILAALSLMAFSVASAQAGVFRVAGNEIAEGLKVRATGNQEGLGTLLVPGRNLKLICHFGYAVEVRVNTSTDALVIARFLECLALNHKTGAALPCSVSDPEAKALLLPKVFVENPYILAESDFGSINLTVIKFSGATCPLPAENPVTGTVAAKVTTNNQAVDLIRFDPSDQVLLGDGLKFGGFAATIEGSATVELTGEHKGMVFGVA